MLARIRILPKILAIVLLLSVAAGGIAYIAISALHDINEKTALIGMAADRSLSAARANQSVLALNRAEFRSALDPSDENRLAARAVVEEQLKLFKDRIDEVSRTTDEKAKAMLPAALLAFESYKKQLDQTLAVVDSEKSTSVTDSARRLREMAMNSRASAEILQSRVRELADRLATRLDEQAKLVFEENESVSRLVSIIAVSAVLVGGLLGFVIGQFGIAKPVVALCAGMRELANGNFQVVLPGLDRADEVGQMAQAVETFKIKAEQKAREEAEAKAQQDKIAAQQRKEEMFRLADQFEGAVGEIVQTVSSASTELEASATTLTATAERAQEVTTTVAAASEEASTNVQSVASATEEMTSSITEISRQVQESARIARDAVAQAERTNERVGELSQAAGRIGDVVELINTIAGQTNLLALNATIEAARAGEAGRGFAVVASEVKALAEQTAKATGEIGQQINGIQAATNQSVAAIREIGSTISKMSEITSTIASAVEEQGAATQEISRNVQQAAQGTQQVSSNIVDVQRGATETGSASSQVLSAAQSLSRDSNRLKDQVAKFLDSVRAA